MQLTKEITAMTTKTTTNLKPLPHEVIKAKARNFRQHSRQRAKKLEMSPQNLAEIPSAKQLEHWLLDKMDLSNPSKPMFYCAYTSDKIKLCELEIDHVKPLSLGGSLGFDNLCVTSKRINGVKGDMTSTDFFKLLECLEKMTEHSKKSVMSRLYAGNRRFFNNPR